MIRRISPDFAYYLKTRGAYSDFIYYTKRTTNPIEKLTWFDWEKTKQGHDYWRDLIYGFMTYLQHKYHTNAVIFEN